MGYLRQSLQVTRVSERIRTVRFQSSRVGLTDRDGTVLV